MTMFKKILNLFFLVLFLFSSAFPFSPALFAANEAVTSTPLGYTPVQTLEEAQATAVSLPVAKSAIPDDFFKANPLSAAEEQKPAENAVDQPINMLEDEVPDADHPLALSNDTYSGTFPMWGFDRVQAEKAWSLSRGTGITIAVIDTGLDFNHEDILGNVYTNTAELNGLPGVDDDGDGLIDDFRGWDFVNNDNNPFDDQGHGTHVSGIAAAVADNGKGIAGVAPGAKILPIKVLDAFGSGTIQNVIKGIKYAADLGAKVINMSLGIAKRYLSNPLLVEFQNAVNYAFNKGSIVVTAAGNESVDTSTTAPAGLNNTIAVGATDSLNKQAYFSNKNPDLAAPGVNIASLKLGGGYVYMSGTSMSSPFVAGAAALILSYYGPAYTSLKYTAQQIYNDVTTRLNNSDLDLGKKGYDSSFGYGLLDAYKVLTLTTSSALSTSLQNLFGPSSSSVLTANSSLKLRSSSFEEGISDLSPKFPSRYSTGNWYRISYLESPGRRKKSKSSFHRK